ncbi:MAG TPA: phosphonate C-P lyase system protein PhnK [Terriglobia bacterium]|nr:phosphonate C-P lyase system protein PhnK [Terriglobia bacterium]
MNLDQHQPLLEVRDLAKSFGDRRVLSDIGLTLWPGEVLAIVGESGSGKTTLLRCIGGQVAPDAGEVGFRSRNHGTVNLADLSESQRRRVIGSDLGYVHQNPRDGLRLDLSAGANIGEPLLQAGLRHYGRIREIASDWLAKVEIDPHRIDEPPARFSGGMQQRLQIARNLVTGPRLVLMDEPTGGLDVSVQARLLDLLRRLVADLDLAVILVTHDLGVARLLADRLMVMQAGRIIESGLTDQVLDDPHQPYTQLLVSSVLQL